MKKGLELNEFVLYFLGKKMPDSKKISELDIENKYFFV